MSEPFAGAVSLTATRRRRFIYCAFFSAPPCRDPFRPPDAWGSAGTMEEALAAASRAAGHPLPEVEGHWAGAWVRIRAGKPPYFTRERRAPPPPPRRRPSEYTEGCPFAALGLRPTATPAEIRRAFHHLALRTHPDHGGDAVDFVRARRAYAAAMALGISRARAPSPSERGSG